MAVKRDASLLKFQGFCCCMFLEDDEVLKGRSTYYATSELPLYHRLEVRGRLASHHLDAQLYIVTKLQDVLVSFTVHQNGQISY